MSESIDKRTLPPDNPEAEKQREHKESDRYLKLARESPHSLTEEIKKNPKTEPLLRRILWDSEYERIKDLNPVKLSEESGVAKMQKEIYSFVDIQPDTDRNGTKEKFIKGIVDSIIIENSELAMKIIETKWAMLKDMLAQIFSWEWLKQIAEWLKISVLHLFSWDAYKTGKSLGELGLIAIWSGAGGFVLKRVWKWAIQAGERVAVNAGKETIVSEWLQMGWRVTEWTGKVIQAPYNAIESGVKKVWWVIKDGIKTWSEAIRSTPQVQKVIEPARKIISEWMDKLSDGTRRIMTATKERAKEVLALTSVPILVGSKDGIETSSRLKGQIWAIGDDVGKIKLFEKWEWKTITEKPRVSEKPNSERGIIGVPRTLIPFEEFEKLPWGWHPHTKADLLKMYENYKEFISLTPKEQSARIYELHSYLDEKIVWQLAYNDVLWAWNFWIVIKDGNNPQLSFKINKELAKWTLETSTHNRVSALIEAANTPDGSILRKQYKADYGVDVIGASPVNVDVPRIRVWDKWQFTMRTIDGESVLTKMFSEKQWFNWYEWVLEAVKRSYPQGYKFTDYELYRAMADIYKFWEWHLKDRIRDPELQQLKKFTASYVGRNAPQIATLDDFLIRNGIHQWDLHWWNIVVPHNEPWKVYLIDFGEAVLSK